MKAFTKVLIVLAVIGLLVGAYFLFFHKKLKEKKNGNGEEKDNGTTTEGTEGQNTGIDKPEETKSFSRNESLTSVPAFDIGNVNTAVTASLN